jgi:cell division septation protein DedD
METEKVAPVSESTKSYSSSSQNTSTKVRSHSVEGVSVREKSDPFYLVLICMVVLAVVSALAGYRFGFDRGVREGTSITLEQKSKMDLPVRKITQQPTPQTTASPKKTHQASLKPSLPTSIKTLTPEQKRATIPPEELKKYTLQVQTFGRKAIPLAKELVESMKAKGYDSFYDKNDGAVFVGRLKSVGSSDAKQLRNEILRFNWRSRDFTQSFYRSIPKHLLEP